MKLSNLQKYILLRGFENRSKVSKKDLIKYYSDRKIKPKLEDQVNIITKSVERLIERGLVRGKGMKTKDKWFIFEVLLTKMGRLEAKKLLGQQQKLPLKNKK